MQPNATVEKGAADALTYDTVRADILRGFADVVRELGGDAEALLRRFGVTSTIGLGYRVAVNILEHAAAELNCPDFGMRLAMAQRSINGPMGTVMRNSRTFGEALRYAQAHYHVHSYAARIRIERDREAGAVFVGHDILLDNTPKKQQTIEQIFLLGHLNAYDSTGGKARARAILFRHQPLSQPSVYRRYFGCEVRFNQKDDGVVFLDRDLLCPIVDRDLQVYENTASFIAAEFTRADQPMHAQVRGVILEFIGTKDCTNERVAAELNMHPRTLHRRLAAEGTSFLEIKDEIRRDVVLYYLQHTDLDMNRIAEKLGYSEHSVLTRSCTRWFAASPSQLRARSKTARTLTPVS